MLTDDIKQSIRGYMQAIATAKPGFRSRPGQRAMIAEVARTLGRCEKDVAPTPGATIACISAGTGVGKSLAYIIPGIALAADRGKTLVIASSTVALQEQLANHDIPTALSAMGITMAVEVAKSRTRYLCVYRLLQAVGDFQQFAMFDRGDNAQTGSAHAEATRITLETMADDYASGRWNGDRDVRSDVTDDVWPAVTTDRNGCLNRVCPNYKSCAQIEARRRVKNAKIIVANHDYLLADLSMGGGKILPPPADCFHILDEAHNLPSKAVDAFAFDHLLRQGSRAAEKLAALIEPLGKALGAAFRSDSDSLSANAEAIGGGLMDAWQYFSGLATMAPTDAKPSPTLEFPDSCIPDEFFAIGQTIISRAHLSIELLGTASDALSTLIQSGSAEKTIHEKLMADVGFSLSRLERIHSTWELFLAEPAADAPPVAKWVERVPHRHGLDFRICASPVVASGYLQQLLWERTAGVILTSATMTVLGSFDDFLRRTGLSTYPGVVCLEVPSPFDYPRQGTISIPNMTSSPKDHGPHTAEVGGWIASMLEQTRAIGTLVIFASRRQMNDVAQNLPPHLRSQVLVQGAMSKRDTLREHKRRLDGGQCSTVFGLESYAEGVDLPGIYCARVVIPKLPFSAPDTPVLRALCNWIERRGGNPFMEVSVTDAARKLEQRVGRLIRTEDDSGEVVVLDPRLWNTRYGKSILRGLPPFRIVVNGKEVHL